MQSRASRHRCRQLFAAVIVTALRRRDTVGRRPPAHRRPSSPAAAPGQTIKVATDAKLGQILVDSAGKTVYLFVADKSTASTCYTSCAQFWPPVLTTGAPVAGDRRAGFVARDDHTNRWND